MLTILTTGGTIDKIYFDEKSAYQVGEAQIGEILQAFKVAFEFQVISLLKKDSLEMTDKDRQLIYNTIAGHDNDRFIITHGTDTMIETALQLLPLAEQRVIVLTGALNPTRFVGSDAVFNIGTAVAACQTLTSGVHIAMSGRIWDPMKVRKNREASRFEGI